MDGNIKDKLQIPASNVNSKPDSVSYSINGMQMFSKKIKTNGQNQEFSFAQEIHLEFSLFSPVTHQLLLSR